MRTLQPQRMLLLAVLVLAPFSRSMSATTGLEYCQDLQPSSLTPFAEFNPAVKVGLDSLIESYAKREGDLSENMEEASAAVTVYLQKNIEAGVLTPEEAYQFQSYASVETLHHISLAAPTNLSSTGEWDDWTPPEQTAQSVGECLARECERCGGTNMCWDSIWSGFTRRCDPGEWGHCAAPASSWFCVAVGHGCCVLGCASPTVPPPVMLDMP